MTFKDFILKNKKEETYNFYNKVVRKPQAITKVTKIKMYEEIIANYTEYPEIILNMLTTEQIEILRVILQEDNYKNEDYGYLNFMVLKDLKLNHLVFANEEKVYIPEDLINPVKMAINIYNKDEYLNLDIVNNVVLGLIRIYNVVKLDDFLEYLKDYQIVYKKDDFKKYCHGSLRNYHKIGIRKYHNVEYVISLEIPTYKDIIDEVKEDIEPFSYSLEEVISIGKYWLNLFDKEQINFLTFIEVHLPSMYIEKTIKDVILYSGFGISNEELLKAISGNINSLYEALKKVYPSLPCWIYKGWPQKKIKTK